MSAAPARDTAGRTVAQVFAAGLGYFLVVFGVAFVLGVIRELWVAPRLGARAAELLEAPVMLAVLVFAASWIIARTGLTPAAPARIAMGLIALSLLLGAEVAGVIWLRELTLEEYFNARDLVSLVTYAVLVTFYALMPLAVLRER